MTVKADFVAIMPTATAKSSAQTHAADIPSLQSIVSQKIAELQIALKALIAVHPNSGGDTTNYTALTNLLAELN